MTIHDFYLTRDQVREIDRRAIQDLGLPGIVLMENAGRNAAHVLLSLGVHGPVAICCGKGNNGGDGFVIARHLYNYGIDVRVLLFTKADDVSGDAAVNLGVVRKMPIPFEEMDVAADGVEKCASHFAQCQWIVDALFGTGLMGEVRPPFDQVIAAINDSRASVLAVDIPSGLNCDTGEAIGPTICADHTVTFVAPKVGFAKASADEYLGKIHIADIGVSRRLLDELPAQE